MKKSEPKMILNVAFESEELDEKFRLLWRNMLKI